MIHKLGLFHNTIQCWKYSLIYAMRSNGPHLQLWNGTVLIYRGGNPITTFRSYIIIGAWVYRVFFYFFIWNCSHGRGRDNYHYGWRGGRKSTRWVFYSTSDVERKRTRINPQSSILCYTSKSLTEDNDPFHSLRHCTIQSNIHWHITYKFLHNIYTYTYSDH